jgi:replication initiator protein RepSA
MMTASPVPTPTAGRPGPDHPDVDLARIVAGETLAHTGACTHPIRLTGSSLLISPATGELLHRLDSADLPGGSLTVRCGNRRASVCPACSALYKYDTYQLITAGLRGGKQIPATVTDHPQLFVTLTAPSFGPVHLGPAKDGTRRPCRVRSQGPACRSWHRRDDPLVGSPLQPDQYDYAGHVLFNAHAGVLWARFTIETRRALADLADLSRADLSAVVQVAFVKVAEFQTRGIVHFHAIIRLDSRGGPTSPPPRWADLGLLERAVRRAASRASVRAPDIRSFADRTFRWGRQLDLRPINSTTTDQEDMPDREDVIPGTVAARYIAKYATKGTETTGAQIPPIACRRCSGIGHTVIDTENGRRTLSCASCDGWGRIVGLADLELSDHARRLIETCWRLGGIPGLADLRLRRWAHTFGFRGHFATKSRAYSTTFGALRAERTAYTTARQTTALGLSTETTETVKDWRYAGSGHLAVGTSGGAA